MRVKLLKAVYVQDGLRTIGEVLELDRETANRLVLLGAAEPLELVKHAIAAEPVLDEEASEEQAAEPQAKSKRRKE